jgi:hypothetical protein
MTPLQAAMPDTPCVRPDPSQRKYANDPAGHRNGAPELSIVASFRALAAGALDGGDTPWPGRASTRRTANFFHLAPTKCRFGALRNDISTEGSLR